VIGYGSDGLTDDLSGPWKAMIMGYAHALVDAGCHALVPDYLAYTGTAPGLAAMMAIPRHRDAWLRVFEATIDHAAALPVRQPARIGLLGFSLGGHLCLRVRHRASILVEFFAPILDGIGVGGFLAHAQIHHGRADHLPGTDFGNALRVEALLRSEGTATDVYDYAGAGHGFIGDDLHNTSARDLSRRRTLAFFAAHMAATSASQTGAVGLQHRAASPAGALEEKP
jgi:dienelactone hydrolase